MSNTLFYEPDIRKYYSPNCVLIIRRFQDQLFSFDNKFSQLWIAYVNTSELLFLNFQNLEFDRIDIQLQTVIQISDIRIYKLCYQFIP